jgi:hypothetical protein
MNDKLLCRIASVIRNELVLEWPQDQEIDRVAKMVLEAIRDVPDELGNHLPLDYKPGSHSARDIWESIIDSAIAS